jgi:transcriptional regulator with XRE-family HTH domain
MSTCKISSVLPRILAERKMSQSALAKKAGVPLSTLSTWLIPNSKPRDLEACDRTAAALGVSFEELVFDRKPREQQIDLQSFPLEKLFDGFFKIRLERVILPEHQTRPETNDKKKGCS